MKILSCEQMRMLEQRAVEGGIGYYRLMENAGISAAKAAFWVTLPPSRQKIPALETSIPPISRDLRYSLNRPSAMGLLHEFPEQTKITLFIYQPFASYQVFPIFASLKSKTFILQAFSISSLTIVLTLSASCSGLSTINSSCTCKIRRASEFSALSLL